MTPSQPAQWQSTWFWRPNLLVFLSSACIMTLELAIGRITAPYVGVSLYTWTIVIGVVLAGISLGNYVGGWIADRWTSQQLLGRIFVLGGLSSLSILAIDAVQTFSSLDRITPDASILYCHPGAIRGCVMLSSLCHPGNHLTHRYQISCAGSGKTGRTIGQIYASGTAGSIVGTFATGFFLISRFGTRPVILGLGMLLLFIGLVLLLGRRWLGLLLSILILGSVSAVVVNSSWLAGPCLRETNYYCIRVQEDELDGEPVRKLVLDRLVHSYSFVDNPTKLAYGYEKLYAEATAYQAQRKENLNTLFIGGGGYTFPRYMEAVYPNSDIHVIEIDPGVTEIAHEMLGLSRDTRVRTYNEDARMFLEREPNASYDLIYGDAFNDYTVPYHLTTLEFNERVHAWLAEDGIYIVNLIDGPYGNFMRAYALTLRQTFRYVYIALNVDTWRQTAHTTIVFIASDRALDMEALQSIETGDDNPQLADLLLTEDTLDGILAEGRSTILSDSYAPTDYMLLPVFLDQVPDPEK